MKLDPELPWTMRHAFFADMGGFVLKAPDSPLFPVDAQQMHYLVAKNHVPFPAVDEKDIRDKNKADGFARFITVWQTAWFAVQCIGRLKQHLPLNFRAFNTSFRSLHDPNVFLLAPQSSGCRSSDSPGNRHPHRGYPHKAGCHAHDLYNLTPLDFVGPTPSNGRSVRAFRATVPFWYSLERMLGLCKYPSVRPIETFGNIKRIAPRGLSLVEATIGSTVATAYTGLHLVGWNFAFPTYIEQTFWRAASSVLVGLLVGYLLFISIGPIAADRIAQKFFNVRAASIMELFCLVPFWAQALICLPALGAYGSARLYIIVEAFISLRALPVSAYDSVNWPNLIPHF